MASNLIISMSHDVLYDYINLKMVNARSGHVRRAMCFWCLGTAYLTLSSRADAFGGTFASHLVEQRSFFGFLVFPRKHRQEEVTSQMVYTRVP